jgi:hypothetical protein
MCINHTDDIEKGHQIRQMHHIYRHARLVVVWLGIATADSDLALTFARQIYDQFSDDTRQRVEIGAKLKCFMKPQYIPSWVALHGLLSRPW